MRQMYLQCIVFISGAVVMVLEIVGTRLLAPYFGTSLLIWTAIISVVLASLSIGYFFGGKLADKNATYEKLAFFLFSAGVFIGLTPFFQGVVLTSIADLELSLLVRALLASVLILAPGAVLLGIVSPYAARLCINSLSTSGATIGRLNALSAIGSIVGTVLAGTVLFLFFGSTTILSMLAAILLLLSLCAYRKLLFILVVLACAFFFLLLHPPLSPLLVADIDTAYHRVWVKDTENIRILFSGGTAESGKFTDGNLELLFPYTRLYRLVQHFAPETNKAVMLGGAGYSYPRDFLRQFPEATIDVVEIDPGMTQVARDYFGLVDDPRLHILHEDGRVFINETKNKYDAFFGDAFGSSISVPYQLTTHEAAIKVHELLSDDGVALINLIGSVEGDTGKFIRAEYFTYKEVFPYVYLIPVDSNDGLRSQNIMLVALKSKTEPNFVSSNLELQGYLDGRWTEAILADVPILTDDFAPVDQYVAIVERASEKAR